MRWDIWSPELHALASLGLLRFRSYTGTSRAAIIIRGRFFLTRYCKYLSGFIPAGLVLSSFSFFSEFSWRKALFRSLLFVRDSRYCVSW